MKKCVMDDAMEILSDREKSCLDILSVKKEARLSASEPAAVQEGRGEDDLVM